MRKYDVAARSKLEKFAPMISLYAERGVLSVRNANIVSVIRLKKVSTSYECDTFLVGSRHLDREMRYLFWGKFTIFAK